MRVKKLMFNWRQVGSTTERDGAGEDFDTFEVGKHSVVKIEENKPCNGLEQWNYLVSMDDGKKVRVFNPNFVEYFAPGTIINKII